MAQLVFMDANVVSGPFESELAAELMMVRMSRDDAGQPTLNPFVVRAILLDKGTVPYGHRFPVRKGRLVSQPDTYPNRWYVLKG
jgi:hypothetical protein